MFQSIAEGILEFVNDKSGPTPWISNLVVVPKDKSVSMSGKFSKPVNSQQQYEFAIRLTCDNRAVNQANKRTRFPSKTVENLIYLLNSATVFSKVDIIKAFHQAMLAEASLNLTTITAFIWLLQYKRLQTGISCAEEVFTERLRVIQEKCPGKENMTDDILVFGKNGKNEAKHEENLMMALKTLEKNGLTLSKEKCQFFKDEVTFFGHKFNRDGVSPRENRFKILREAPAPVNAKELRSFLCSMLWSSRFIKNACITAEPLWRLTRAGTVRNCLMPG